MYRLMLLLSLLPLAGWTGEVEGFSLKEEHLVEACIASFNKAGERDESAYWMENYLVDLQAVAIYETVLDFLLQEGKINRFDIEEAVADCKRARQAENDGQGE